MSLGSSSGASTPSTRRRREADPPRSSTSRSSSRRGRPRRACASAASSAARTSTSRTPRSWSAAGAGSARPGTSSSPRSSPRRWEGPWRRPERWSTPAGTRTRPRSARPARRWPRSSTWPPGSRARSSTRSGCRTPRTSSRSTRTRTPRSSSSPTSASSATCTRSCPSSRKRSRPRRGARPPMSVVPKQFPPPVDEAEFIAAPTDPEEERIGVGVAIVGGGPAGLACANRLLQLLDDEPELTERLGEVPVAVIEKGKACGAHGLSGANLRPAAMRELFPELEPDDWPFAYQEVTKDAVYLLTKKLALPLVPMPPNFRNHGDYVVSVAKLSRFLAERAEAAGAYILTETVADKLLVEDRIVRGIRSGDRGRGKDGEPLANFEPGSDVVASATVLAEGTLGHLTQAATDYFDLHGALPVRWELGVKEVWEIPEPLDRVIHT